MCAVDSCRKIFSMARWARERERGNFEFSVFSAVITDNYSRQRVLFQWKWAAARWFSFAFKNLRWVINCVKIFFLSKISLKWRSFAVSLKAGRSIEAKRCLCCLENGWHPRRAAIICSTPRSIKFLIKSRNVLIIQASGRLHG